MRDSIPIARLKKEIAHLRRLHKQRSIEELEMVDSLEERRGATTDAGERLLQAILETVRQDRSSLEAQLADRTRALGLEAPSLPPATRRVRASRSDYTTVNGPERLYVDDIDSFEKVKDVGFEDVKHLVRAGFVPFSEDQVQTALESILQVPFHRKDWGGEVNDLYTSNLAVAGKRRAAAFLLKGPGVGRKPMSIRDCGKRGDQIVRLFDSPADLFVVQYVGPIADLLIKDVQAKVTAHRAAGKDAQFLIMDGQDTARVLFAYGTL